MVDIIGSTAIAVAIPEAYPLAEARIQITEFQRRSAALLVTKQQTAFERLMLTVEMWLAISSYGGPESDFMEMEAEAAGATTSSKHRYFNAVDFLEAGAPVASMPKKTRAQQKAKKDRRNFITRQAQLLAALDELYERLPASMSPKAIAEWIEENGSLNGVVALANPPEGRNDNQEGEPLDEQPFLSALSGLNALELDAPDHLIAPRLNVAVYQRSGDKLRLVPLTALPDQRLAELARFMPAPETNLSGSLNFLGRLFAFSILIPRTDSDERMRPLDGDVAAGLTLPSLPMVFFDGAKFSIAPSRRSASIVVECRCTDEDLCMPWASREAPIHFRTQHVQVAQAELAPVECRTAYQPHPENMQPGGKAVRVITEDDATDLVLKSVGKTLKLRLLPLSKFGSSGVTTQWTLRVSSKYRAKAQAELSCSSPEGLDRFLGKASGSNKHNVKVTIADGKLSLQLGEAAPLKLESGGSGSASITVRADDFSLALSSILDLEPSTGAQVHIDPKGLLQITGAKSFGEFSIFVPALMAGEDGSVRSTALLERVERTAA